MGDTWASALLSSTWNWPYSLDNIDYNDIKQLIKIHTTDAKSRPTPIPGKENETNEYRSFDDELQEELYNQHQRIGLFVHCKAGEITRRLCMFERDHCEWLISTHTNE